MRKGTIPDALPSSSAILKRPASCWFDRRQCRDTRTRGRTSCRLAVPYPGRFGGDHHARRRRTRPRAGRSIVVASTTSTQDSGLFGHILPLFKQKTGIVVKVVAQGTGKALDTARRGDADVVFVHAREAEEKFIAEGHGVKRYSVMYNDFVIIGPKDDPASIKGSRNAAFALQSIKAKGAPFISRGD